MEPVTTARLKVIDALKDVPDDQLEWLIAASEDHLFEDGEFLFKTGDAVVYMQIILSGKIKLSRVQNGQYEETGEFVTDTIIGYLPFSRIKAAMGSGVCAGETRVLSCHADKLKDVISKYYELTEALVHVMSSRIRSFTSWQQQNEKMLALGKLSAGLAHELNNPAAALLRSAAALNTNINAVPEIFRQMTALQLSYEQTVQLVDRVLNFRNNNHGQQLSLIELSDRESELYDWLEEKSITDTE
ncbi:MAG TPA: Crp/Fnr family transcriptional regulator, partial [Chitinophaga sp.]|uniref:Crp/Fnr family transcriptional regulator n=1 Tax=Chitinophaga sp. TaxID=1869181 RepID=UPI002C27B1A0